MRHKIWESGRNPSKRNDKGKKKPQALRQAKARLSHFKKRHMTSPKKGGFFVSYSHTIQIK
jgi:Ni/Co efflux regulator RcnB